MSEQDLDGLPTITTTKEGFVGINFPTSERLTNLTNYALAKAINILNKSYISEPLLVIRVIDNDEISVYDYKSSDNKAEVANSIDSLPGDVKAYALVATASIPFEDQNHDAIFIEVGERGQEEGYQFAQKYKAKGLFSAFARIDLPVLLRKIPQRLK